MNSVMRRIAGVVACAVLALALTHGSPRAQDTDPLRPGEAYTTRFSGITEGENADGEIVPVIDLSGLVGSIIDLRRPGHAPAGEHWFAEPQRAPLTAGEVGQVFGIAIDDRDPANVFLAATSAFGLHLTDTGEWMPGMWGPDGGPGTIYRLNGNDGYEPEVFADITLDGRQNSGPSLGNIAYDRENGQLFVSDLETGMIHRLDAESGEELGRFDHGVDGRSYFIDAETDEYNALEVEEFDPESAAQIEDCEDDFSQTPECWNVADYRRRVWGLGLFEADGRQRLYYAIWSSDPLGNEDWSETPEDQANTVWSIAIADDGSFDIQDVRRELTLPPFDDLGTDTGSAVSDIAFSHDGTMLLAERGGLFNLGLEAPQTFATPNASRVLQYKLNGSGKWELIARFDVGFYDRVNDGKPYLRANSSGGVDFGYDYTEQGIIDPNRSDRMIWTSGDYLCSPQGPCNDPEFGPRQNSDHVHGLQGTPRVADSLLLPDGAIEEYPVEGDPYPARGPNTSYLIDLDFNIDDSGRIDEEEADRDDRTRSGDVEVYKAERIELPPEPVHAKQLSAFHNKFRSYLHDKVRSLPIHTKAKSHSKAKSNLHVKPFSHYKPGSKVHVKPWSHHKPGSHKKIKSIKHVKPWSHFKPKSKVHVKPWSHHKPGSHKKIKSIKHVKPWSHFKPGSKVHVKPWSHHKPGSHKKIKSIKHAKPWSHFKPGSHQKVKSLLHIKKTSKFITNPTHVKPWSHNKPGSHKKVKSLLHIKATSKFKTPKPTHVKPWSHHKPGSHKKVKSLLHIKATSKFKGKTPKPVHVKPWSHHKPGSHKKVKSLLHIKTTSKFKGKTPKPVHVKPWSHNKPGSHAKVKSALHIKATSKFKVKQPAPIHVKPWSHNKPGSHSKVKSALHIKATSKFKVKQPAPVHVKPWSHNKPGSHAKVKSTLHIKATSKFNKTVTTPKLRVRCIGGKLVGGKCACPRNRPNLVNGRCLP